MPQNPGNRTFLGVHVICDAQHDGREGIWKYRVPVGYLEQKGRPLSLQEHQSDPLVFGRLSAMGRCWILGDMKIRLLLQAVPRNTTVVSDRL